MNISYYGVIPATVRYDKDITANAKLLYSELTTLTNKYGYCYASNQYFADLYGTSKETISRWISSLNQKNYIRIQFTYKNGTKEIDKRLIYINDVPKFVEPSDVLIKTSIPSCENNQYPLDKNVKDNNTRVNNTSINKEISKEKLSESEIEKADSNVKVVSMTDAVKQIYNAYPRKLGKAKGVEYILAYLGKGRKVAGFGNIKFNHEELYCAVKHYSIECERNETESDFIKHFSTFMNKDIIDYVDLAKEKGYEDYMERTYGSDWRKVKFVYKQ